MKSHPANPPWKPWRRSTNARAFTLAEMMVTMAVFGLVVTAMVSVQFFGFKMSSLTQSKLINVGYGLKALDAIRDEVRSASSVQVGNGTGVLFTVTGTLGNTLQIYPTTNSNHIQVYLDTNADSLYVLNSTNSSPFLIASGIINQSAFQTVGYQGNISTNAQEHYAITMTLQFSQVAYKLPTNTYDYYTLQATMTPRSQN